MENKILYMHVGTGKTGTSALQQFFYDNRAVLKRKGILYPSIGMENKAHHRFSASCYEVEKRPFFMQYPNLLTTDQYIDRLNRLPGHVLLSSELMWHGRYAQKITALQQKYTVKIVAYLRRQDSLLMSRLNQHAKVTREPFTNAMDYLEKIKYAMDYPLVLGRWEQVFGRENILVRPYEKQQFFGGHIFADFLHYMLGLDWSDAFTIPEKNANPRLSKEALEYKRMANFLIENETQNQCLVEALLDYSTREDTAAAELFGQQHLLSPRERLEVIGRYEQGNAKVAREYLGREDGRLFYDDLPDPEDFRESGLCLSAEKIRQITLFLSDQYPDVFEMVSMLIAQTIRQGDPVSRQAAQMLIQGYENPADPVPAGTPNGGTPISST